MSLGDGAPMRILHVVRFGSIMGGAETYVAALCEGLRAAGHDTALVYGEAPDGERPEVAAGVALPAIAAGEPDPAGLTAAIERYAPDLVHVHTPELPWVAAAARALSPVMVAVHDHRLNCPTGTKYWTAWHRACSVKPGPWCLGYNAVAHCGSLKANATLRPYRGWRAARAGAEGARIQVFSRFMRGMLSRAGVDASSVAVTHYPVPPRPPAVPVHEQDPRPVVLVSGRLNKEKGFHDAIDALTRVRGGVHLVVAGGGHERRALERRARTTPGPHRITFTGWLSPGELAGWRERAALVLVPSMWPEPFGIAGLEAMAAGRAVLAFDTGGIPEWLEDGRTGRLVPAGDVRALGDTMAEMMADDAGRARMGAAGAARARSEFSLALHMETLLPIYEDVCAPR